MNHRGNRNGNRKSAAIWLYNAVIGGEKILMLSQQKDFPSEYLVPFEHNNVAIEIERNEETGGFFVKLKEDEQG